GTLRLGKTVTNQVQRLTFLSSITAGTFTLAYNASGNQTVTYSTTPATLQANIQTALDNIFGVGNATAVVNGLNVDITFSKLLAGQNLASLSVNGGSLAPAAADAVVQSVARNGGGNAFQRLAIDTNNAAINGGTVKLGL